MSKAAGFWSLQGRNFMTPEIIRYQDLDSTGLLIELSEGTGLDHQPIYGISVARISTGQRDFNLSRLFFSLEDAENHIKNLSDAGYVSCWDDLEVLDFEEE